MRGCPITYTRCIQTRCTPAPCRCALYSTVLAGQTHNVYVYLAVSVQLFLGMHAELLPARQCIRLNSRVCACCTRIRRNIHIHTANIVKHIPDSRLPLQAACSRIGYTAKTPASAPLTMLSSSIVHPSPSALKTAIDATPFSGLRNARLNHITRPAIDQQK